MESLIFLAIIVLIGGLVIAPIMLLAKMGSLQRDIKDLFASIQSIDNNIHKLRASTAKKKDIEKLLTSLKKNNIVSDEKESPVVEQVVEEEVVETIKEPEIVEPEIFPIVEAQPVEEDIVPVFEAELPLIKEPESGQYVASSRIESREESISTIRNLPIYEVEAPTISEKAPTKSSIERSMGENWLSRIGIVTLVLGIGFFVKYAIDQEWINEIGRVAIGLLTGGLIIGVAHKLKEKYHVFSSILVGGGISVLYITITLAFREYEIFSQSVAFILLIAVTIFSVFISLLYNRQELAIFSLIGGYLSPLMISQGDGNYIVLFSFLLILNAGMLVISLKKDWKILAIISYVLSLIFFWGWLIARFEEQYLGAIIFASLFFVQFYTLAIIKHIRESKILSAFQAILVLTNTMSLLFSTLYILDNYEPDLRGLATIAIAAINAALMIVLFRKSEVDKNLIYLIIAMIMSLVTLAVPIQLEGYVITLFWAAETVLLLWLWQRSKMDVFQIGFFAIGLLMIISYLMDITDGYYMGVYYSPFSNSLFITGIVVTLSVLASFFLLKKEDQLGYIKIKKFELCQLGNITELFKYLFIILTFLVFYLELNHQTAVYTHSRGISDFKDLMMSTYAILFIAGLTVVLRNKINRKGFYTLLVTTILFTFIYPTFAFDVRANIFKYEEYSSGHFFIHLLYLVAISYMIYTLAKNIKTLGHYFTPLCWVLVILTFVNLSIELDHLVIWLFSTPDTYSRLLYDVHTFGYPILWGLIAMALMIWGLKAKEVVLRQIALISFGLIILKFYAYDVWKMSQAGRIVSFVVLGIILLEVSFMQQKIKVLVKEDEEESTIEKE